VARTSSSTARACSICPSHRRRSSSRRAGRARRALAATKGDALIATEPKRELVSAYHDAGGRARAASEVSLCWAESADEALDTMHRYARWSKLDWHVLPELAHDARVRVRVAGGRRDDLARRRTARRGALCGRDRALLDAGFDELILHQIGPSRTASCDSSPTSWRPRCAALPPEPK
jgi:hypothetical protein